MVLPITAIIATRNRASFCRDLLKSISQQDQSLAEIIFCDSSDDDSTRNTIGSSAHYLPATERGAAPQRNQAILAASQPFVLIMDDDITLEPNCFSSLWSVMQSIPPAGGVTATIVNEAYTVPGRWTKALLKWFEGGRERATYAGACVGPGYTFWPADDANQAEAVPVEWMGTGMALYRRELLPTPPFPSIFHGASLCEDLALSLNVAKRAPLFQASRARYIHLNAGGDHKANVRKMASMNLVNRHYVMTQVMGKCALGDYVQFAVMIAFGMIAPLKRGHLGVFINQLLGSAQGCAKILSQR
ncbi:MAG: glycosyltransferase [Verrucomicrobia bacterium]|nr:glycosyltransferase [Verrucomicrobiota bacterium]